MINQTPNKLAPFRVEYDDGTPVMQVDRNGVMVDNLNFPDGSKMYSAGTLTTKLPPEIDSGTF